MPASDLIYLGRTGMAGSNEVMRWSFGKEVEEPVDEGCPWRRGVRSHGEQKM